MHKRDSLTELIHLLTPNESRYFRLYSSIQTGEKKYMELFEVLEKDIQHSTESLCAALMVKPAQLAVTRNYLYHLLLRSLRNFDDTATPFTILTNNIEEAKIFVRKRMYEHALDIVEATLIKACELEAFEMIDDLLRIKYVIICNNYKPDKMKEVMEMHNKTAEAKDELMKMMELAVLARKAEVQREKERNGMEKVMTHTLMKRKPGQFKSFRARIEWFDTMFNSLYLQDETANECAAVVRNEVKNYEKTPRLIAISPLAWLVCLSRASTVEYKLKNYGAALLVSDKFSKEISNTLLPITKTRRKNLDMHNKLFRIHVLLRLADFENVVEESEELAKLIETGGMYNRYTSLYLHAIGLVHLHHNKAAKQKINELLQLKTAVRKDLQPYARVLLIMAHVNSGNIELIPNLVTSAKMWLGRNKLPNKEITLFFKHILFIANHPLQKRAGWAKLQQDIASGKFEQTQDELLIGEWVSGVIRKQKNA